MTIEHIRVSAQAREQLIRLKRHTGIEHWNVLCRWALCRSFAEPTPPAPSRHPADSNVEMSWRTFAGQHGDLFMALLRERCLADGLDDGDETISHQFRLHLHRGLAYLASDKSVRTIEGLTRLCGPRETTAG